MPRSLLHDCERNVLVIEDLGDMCTVDRWLEESTEQSESMIVDFATKLGAFLAEFHLSTNTQNREYLRTQFRNDDIHGVIYAQVIRPVLGILQDYHISNFNEVYGIIEKGFHDTHKHPYEILSLGDLWPGSILISQSRNEIGVVDWEFAGLAHPSQDIGQFGSFLSSILIENSGASSLQDTHGTGVL